MSQREPHETVEWRAGKGPGTTRVAFFGGSFDPPHLGHLAVARAAREALRLDIVLFTPVGAQPLKPEGSTAGFADRVAMTRLAIMGNKGFAVSLADAPKPAGEPNYTLETLLKLRAELGAGSTLFCLMGADSYFSLRRWHRAAEVPFAAPLIVASRPGEPLDALQDALPAGLKLSPALDAKGTGEGLDVLTFELTNPAGERAPFYVLPGLHEETSATEMRKQIGARSGAAQDEQAELPAAVADYIRAHELYR
jgi:nicotinate-nucleotide adenylyltransferase